MKPRTPATDLPYQALARVMKQVREARGISLRRHAKELGFSPSTLLRIEHGRGCDLIKLVTIRERTGVAYDVLLGDRL